MFLNPELFSITQSKEMGIWPPSDLSASVMMPYIRRMPTQVNVLDVGTEKGENVFRFIELDVKNKIDTIYTIKTSKEYDELVDTNLKNHYGKVVFAVPVDPVDIVCVNSKTDLDTTLKQYYRLVKTNGIFCGNNHADERVMKALSKFRRENKIGTPISVALDTWFWYKR